MSSLLQFNGRIVGRKVGLLFQVDGQEMDCATCGRKHPAIFEAFRRPRGMFGCWVIFEYNGEKHVPDLSIPITVDRLPRDAKRVDDQDASKYWHS